jgi:hypothetical protein
VACAVASCAPRLDLDGRPPPCKADWGLCQTTGQCVPVEALSGLDRGSDALCPESLTVRQGATLIIPVPGATGDDIELTSADDLIANVSWNAPSPAAIEVSAPHGTFPGDSTRKGPRRALRFKTTSGGVTIDREIYINVSPIAASATGDDAALGTTEHPFRSFARAATVAESGDTILLSNGLNGAAADGEDPPTVVLHPGVTVHGRDVGGTLLYMKLVLEGNATLEGLYFKRARLVISAPRTHVAMHDCLTAAGIEVAASAVGTDLSIAGAVTEIRADDGEHEPLLVAADESTVTIETDSNVVFAGREDLAAIHLTGNRQALTVLKAGISNSTGERAVNVEGSAAVVMIGTKVHGRVDLTHPEATAELWSTNFWMGQGDGGVHFRGAEMKVRGSQFNTTGGIEQNNPASLVSVRGTTFSRYTRFGYRLLAGRADLGDDTDDGGNRFAGRDETTLPPAILIDAPKATGSRLTVSGTAFDVTPPVAPCEITGPAEEPGLYKITDQTPIHFY